MQYVQTGQWVNISTLSFFSVFHQINIFVVDFCGLVLIQFADSICHGFCINNVKLFVFFHGFFLFVCFLIYFRSTKKADSIWKCSNIKLIYVSMPAFTNTIALQSI